MSNVFYSDLYKVKCVSGFYTTLLVFWSLFQILNILTYNNFLSMLGALPAVVLTGLYLIAWVVMMFNGNKLGLGFAGYIGAMMVLAAVIITIILQLIPMQDVLTGDIVDWQHTSIVVNLVSGFAVLLNIVGIFLFLLGARSSILLAVVTPLYFVLSFILNILISSFLGWLGISFAAAQSGCSILMLVFILIVLLPIFLLWRRGAAFAADR